MQKNIKNTPVNVPQIPAIILFTGKFLQFISHTLATEFAVKLFITPIKFKTPEREKKMEKNAQKTMMFIPEIQKEVMVYRYGKATKKVLLIHGWAGRGTQLYKIADKLLENNFMTVSFDAPAHGKSTGKTTMMTEFIATAKFLEKEMGPFQIAIGHSLGAMAVLNSIKQGLQVKKVITIGSGDVITHIIEDFVKKLALKKEIVGSMKKHFFKKFKSDIDDYSANIAAKDVTVPTLVIHDTTDKDVPVSCAHTIRQNLQQGELLITQGLGHNHILKDREVILQLIAFIKRNNL